jgi:hypothetical protein
MDTDSVVIVMLDEEDTPLGDCKVLLQFADDSKVGAEPMGGILSLLLLVLGVLLTGLVAMIIRLRKKK